MCMKNLNMNIVFCDIVSNPDNSSISLGGIGKVFSFVVENNVKKISQLPMVIFVSATQSKNPEIIDKLNPNTDFIFSNQYEVKVRLTETISGDFQDLGEFEIDPSKSYDANGLCKSTFNYTQLCLFSDVVLHNIEKSKQRYVIKLLIRQKNRNKTTDDRWIVQTIHPLQLCQSDI